MRIIFYILSIFLVSACSQFQEEVVVEEPKTIVIVEQVVVKEECTRFPYDLSDSPCNILGWTTYAHKSLMHTPKEHYEAFLFKDDDPGMRYKRLILLTSHYQNIETRTQAMNEMFALSRSHINSFGHFFKMLAIYTEKDLIKSKEAMQLKAKLKKINKSNVELKNELANAQSKIEAIMDIEKDLNTN